MCSRGISSGSSKSTTPQTVSNRFAFAFHSQSTSTQTEVSTDHSLLVTIPRSLVDSRALQPLSMPQGRRRHSSMVDMAIDSAITMDSLERGYLPRGHVSWRSYAAMVGMNILQQIVNF
ncbi:hypothetical protein ElyMa_003235600 [Elysia marginata]|uniref:Uncharacterized protein n=1 Tax=Elysia marginata TaxID=1093978 RepID=A0AAV4J3K3_9GAST|nr:hypothetical protein ElyMa_003235600 [Elysia marginata]